MSFVSLADAFAQAVQTAYGIVISDRKFYVAAQTLVPSGTILPYAGSSAPNGFLICDGSAQLRATYATLFGIIGITYGAGNGTTTFNLPDCRGLFLRGVGTNGLIAASNGAGYTGTLAAYTGDQIQGHFHSITAGNFINVASAAGSKDDNPGNSPFPALAVGSPTTDGTNGTPRTGAETRPANIGVNYMIAT